MCFCTSCISYKNWGNVSVTKIYDFIAVEKSPDLKDCFTHPALRPTTDRHPKSVALIIGESFNRDHSSLYGYKRDTNPNPNKLVTDSSLILFNDVKSAYFYTLESITRMFRQAHPNIDQSLRLKRDDAFDATNLMYMIMDAIGYEIVEQ